jgi:hypothetical protein
MFKVKKFGVGVNHTKRRKPTSNSNKSLPCKEHMGRGRGQVREGRLTRGF